MARVGTRLFTGLRRLLGLSRDLDEVDSGPITPTWDTSVPSARNEADWWTFISDNPLTTGEHTILVRPQEAGDWTQIRRNLFLSSAAVPPDHDLWILNATMLSLGAGNLQEWVLYRGDNVGGAARPLVLQAGNTDIQIPDTTVNYGFLRSTAPNRPFPWFFPSKSQEANSLPSLVAGVELNATDTITIALTVASVPRGLPRPF